MRPEVCRRGHFRTPENTSTQRGGYKRCLACKRENERKQRFFRADEINAENRVKYARATRATADDYLTNGHWIRHGLILRWKAAA